MKKKIALCFLLYETIKHEPIWKRFLKGHEDRYTVYSHPKVVTSKTSQFIKKTKIRTIKTEWCDESLVFAFLKMVKKGLDDPSNEFFCILSGTCLPLYDFDKVYKKVFKYSQSRIAFIPKKSSLVFEGDTSLHPHSQWMILNREQCVDAIRLLDKKDMQAKEFLDDIRQKYRTHKRSKTWYSYCMDELYLGEWFVRLYGETNTASFKKQIRRSMTTYVEFAKWDSEHPNEFTLNDLKYDNDKKLKKIKHGSIFARKFTHGAAKYIINTT